MIFKTAITLFSVPPRSSLLLKSCRYINTRISPSMTPRGYYMSQIMRNQILSESKKNFFKILYFSSVEFYPFVFEHFYFFLYGGPRCLSLKSPNPTGCGNNPVSRDLGCIGVSSHGLSDPPICSGIQGTGNFLIGRYAPFGHLP